MEVHHDTMGKLFKFVRLTFIDLNIACQFHSKKKPKEFQSHIFLILN